MDDYSQIDVSFSLPARYQWAGSKSEEAPLLLLLHGYQQHGNLILRILGDYLPSSFRILALNGPFPLPEKTEEGYKVGYSWYFYDSQRDYLLIDREVGVDYVQAVWEALELSGPLVIVGYSQGGYLASMVGRALEADLVITLAGSIVPSSRGESDPFELYVIHGKEDQFVEHSGVLRRFEDYHEQNPRSHLVALDTGHRFCPLMGEQLERILTKYSPS